MHDGLVDHALPALALRHELRDVVRALGHADAVGEAADLVVAPLTAKALVDAERELDVLAGERRRVAADLLEDVPPPDLEAAGRAEHEAEPRPGEAVVEERADEVEMLVEPEQPAVDAPPARPEPRGSLRGSRAVVIWLVTPTIRAGSLIATRIALSSAFGSKTVSASTPHT